MTAPARHLTAVAACMRNEGMFMLEWVAHYRAMGFDRVFVITNGCSDGTDMMADRLQEKGEVIHLRNQINEGEAPQVAGMRHLFADARLADVEWLLHCDADEFLNVTAGDGKIRDLIDAVGDDCDAIAILWRVFGNQGMKDYTPALVTERYTDTTDKLTGFRRWHKTLFRPEKFRWARDHMPKEPYSNAAKLRNTAGQDMSNRGLINPDVARFPGNKNTWTWANAALHHYATRSEDVYMLKNVRGDGMGLSTNKYTLTSRTWKAWNTSGTKDASMHRHVPATRALLQTYQADPVLAPLEQMARHWFAAMKAQHLTPENVLKWSTKPAPEPDEAEDEAEKSPA
jgi:hypothetical protein